MRRLSVLILVTGLLAGCLSPTAIVDLSERPYGGSINAELVDDNIGLLVDPTREYIPYQYIPFKASDINVAIHRIDGKSDYDSQSFSGEKHSIGKGVVPLKAGKHQIQATCNGERWILISRWSILGRAIIDLDVKAGATYYILARPTSFGTCDIYISETNGHTPSSVR